MSDKHSELFCAFCVSEDAGVGLVGYEDEQARKYTYGETLLFFANLAVYDSEMNRLKSFVMLHAYTENIDDYFEYTLALLNVLYSRNITNTIMMDTYNRYYRLGLYADKDMDEFAHNINTVNKISERICSDISGLSHIAKLIIDEIFLPKEKENAASNKNGYISCVISQANSMTMRCVSYSIQCRTNDNEDIDFFEMYVVHMADALLIFESTQILKNGTKIKKCENCGK